LAAKTGYGRTVLNIQGKGIPNDRSSYKRVATNLENLEYSGISLNVENSGNSQEILCNLREKL